MHNNTLKGLAILVASLLLILAAWYLWQGTRGEALTVSGVSMQPTLDPGDSVRLIADPGRDYRQADLVAVKFSTRERLMVKRIIAVAGDKVEKIDDIVHVNGEPLRIPGWPEHRRVADRQWQLLGIQLKNYGNRVPANNVIVMGDNTEKSYDSGDFGMLSLSQISGLVQH